MNPLQKLASSTYRGANRIGKSVSDEFAPAGVLFKDMMAPRTPSVSTPVTSGVQPATQLRDNLSSRSGALGGMMKRYKDIDSYKKGGTVKKTGLAYLHKGETVIPTNMKYPTKKMVEGRHKAQEEHYKAKSKALQGKMGRVPKELADKLINKARYDGMRAGMGLK